jgi:hypothetical protein
MIGYVIVGSFAPEKGGAEEGVGKRPIWQGLDEAHMG